MTTDGGAPELLGGPATVDGAPPESAAAARSVLLRGSSWNVLQQVVPLIGNLVLTPFVITNLGRDAFGLYIFVSVVVAFLGSFDGGVGASALRYFSLYAGTDDRRATTRLLATLVPAVGGLGLVLCAGLFVLAPWGLHLIDVPAGLHDDGTFLFRTLGVLVTLGLLRGLFNSVLLARQRFALVASVTLATYLVYVVGTVVVLLTHGGLRGLALVFVAQAVLSTVVVVPSACRYLRRADAGLLPWRELREFLAYAWRVQLVGIATLVNLQADALVVGAILPVRNVGLYSVGGNFATQLRNVPTNALVPVQTILGRRFGQDGLPGAVAELERLQRLWVLGVCGWCSALLGSAFFAVSAWLGPDFRTAGVVAVVLTAGNTVNLCTGTLTVFCAVIGKPGLEARYSFVSMAINLALTLPLGLPFGVVGVVSATAIAQVSGSLYLQTVVRRAVPHPVRPFVRDVPLPQMVVTVVTVVALELALRPLVPRGVVGLVLCGLPAAAGLAVYGVSVYGPATSLAFVRRAVLPRLRVG